MVYRQKGKLPEEVQMESVFLPIVIVVLVIAGTTIFALVRRAARESEETDDLVPQWYSEPSDEDRFSHG